MAYGQLEEEEWGRVVGPREIRSCRHWERLGIQLPTLCSALPKWVLASFVMKFVMRLQQDKLLSDNDVCWCSQAVFCSWSHEVLLGCLPGRCGFGKHLLHCFRGNLSLYLQVVVVVNDVPANCSGLCSFQFSQEMTPLVSDVEYSSGNGVLCLHKLGETCLCEKGLFIDDDFVCSFKNFWF